MNFDLFFALLLTVLIAADIWYVYDYYRKSTYLKHSKQCSVRYAALATLAQYTGHSEDYGYLSRYKSIRINVKNKIFVITSSALLAVFMLGAIIWWLFAYGPLSVDIYIVANVQDSVKHKELFSKDKIIESHETIGFQGDGEMVGTFQLSPDEITIIMRDKIPIICAKNQKCETERSGVYNLFNNDSDIWSSLIIDEKTSQVTWSVHYY